jgi:hypothetical protein
MCTRLQCIVPTLRDGMGFDHISIRPVEELTLWMTGAASLSSVLSGFSGCRKHFRKPTVCLV